MKYYLIAGEASGDLHGSNLIKEIKKIDTNAEFRCWGGDLIKKESSNELVKHYKTYSYMGFLEVILNIFTKLMYLRTVSLLKRILKKNMKKKLSMEFSRWVQMETLF